MNWRGRWLYELRLAQPAAEGKKKRTQAEFAAELVEKGIALGGDPRIAYVRMEKHGHIDDALMAQIAKAYDVNVPAPPPPPTDEITSLVRALTDLTAQNERLTARLAAHVEATTKLARDQVTTQEYLAAVLSVVGAFQAPEGFDTAGAIRAAADDLQARRLVTNGAE